MSTFFNVVTKKQIPHTLEEKFIHHKIGTIKVTTRGGWYLQLFMFPDAEFQIFPSRDEQLPTINFEENDN